MNIFLVGMPGVGKSFWLKKLKQRYQCLGTDLDLYIEIKEGARIAEIFEKGETYFREKEAYVLRKVANDAINDSLHIISTGGGTPCHLENMDFMLQNGKVIFLEANAEFIKSRLEQAKVIRPMIEKVPSDQRLDYIKQTLEQREFFYKQSHYVIDAVRARMINFEAIFESLNIYS